MKPVAKALIARFGSLAGVLHAGVDDLAAVDGVSENVATAIKTVRAAGLRMMKQDVAAKPVLNAWQELLDYLSASMANEAREHFSRAIPQ